MTHRRKEINKVPNLRFPGFEGDWKNIELGKLGEIISGLTYSPNDIDQEGVLVLRSSNVKNRHIIFDDNVFVKTENFNPVQENDILICVRNGSKNLIGKNAIIEKENEGLAFGAFMSIYRSIYNRYLFQWFDTVDYKKEVYKNLGATINSINGSELKKFKVPFPTPSEQKKVADFLSLIDNRIETQNKIIENLETLIKGLNQKLLTKQLRFKDENGNEFSEWKIRKLGDLTYKVGKKNKGNIQYPIYSINNKEGFLPQGQQFEGMNSNDRGYDISLYKIIKTKTFAYNPARINVGSIGYSGELDNVIISSLYVCFKTNNELDDLYLLQYLNSYNFNKSVLRNVEGGVRQYLFYENFSAIKIPLPSIAEQTKIATFIKSISKKIASEKLLLAEYENQKKYLLQNMFI
jgi:type I restriction enzyme S subunit